MSDTFDYIVIGAGTAGALLANRLSRQHSVLLLEAGGRDNYHWIHIPVGYLYCIGNPRTDWMYRTEPEANLGGRSLLYPRGRVLGGCSSINGMIYMRGQASDYDAWARLTGDETWGWQQVLPAFCAHEAHWRLDAQQDAQDTRFHGHSTTGSTGEWRVERQRLRWDILDAFALAAQQAGIPQSMDFNRGNNEGVGYFEVNQKSGWRWSAAKAFLPRAVLRRARLTLWTGAQARRLLLQGLDGGGLRCTGVQVLKGGHMLDVHARREVLLCAGAINSPQLLQLSGIGPGALLQRHAIPVRRELPGVGENLQDHLQIRAVYQVQGARTLNTLANAWWGKLGIGLQYLLQRSGPMSMAPSQLGAFTRSSPEQAQPDLEYHVQPLSLDAFGQPLHHFDAFTASVCNLKPTSRGRVHIQGSDPLQPPAIAPCYLSTEADRQVAARSLRLTRRIVSQPALAPYAPQEYRPGAQYQSDEELARLAGDIATTIFHPVGTTKMGAASDPMAVLDSRLRVRGVEALRVVDAGAMPVITSGNTNSPTLMMAEKAAGWIFSDSGGQC